MDEEKKEDGRIVYTNAAPPEKKESVQKYNPAPENKGFPTMREFKTATYWAKMARKKARVSAKRGE
jgi:hypothetical protein